MKKCLIFWVILLAFGAVTSQAQNKKSNELQKKSELFETYGTFPGGTSYPLPFNELNQTNNETAASNGYYFYDSHQESITLRTDIWKPSVKFDTDTSYQQNLWTRIVSGPRQYPEAFWANNDKGRHFFRNPADMTIDIFDSQAGLIDTTHHAIAGPMPLGITGGFFFNGIRYDSFYVSQTGVIALTNRRYIYNNNTGQREKPAGATDCYDIYSQDWFVSLEGLQLRERVGDGITDPVQDNFGYVSSVLGRNPNITYTSTENDPFFNHEAGIRSFGNGENIGDLTGIYDSPDSKPALIAPFWGQVCLSQYDAKYQRPEDYGKVYFKTTENKTQLIIAFYNVSLYGEEILNLPAGDYNVPKDSRPGVPGYCEWDAKVILDKGDSSVTFVYENMYKEPLGLEAQAEFDCGDILRINTIAGVFGWTRTVNYDSKDASSQVIPGDTYYPWFEENMQYTNYFPSYDITSVKNKYPRNNTIVKFKQWKNTLRAVNMTFKIRNSDQEGPDYDYDFTEGPINGSDYELLAGEELIGAIQPIGLFQNLTNEIQGPSGVNFTSQDLEFVTKMDVTNIITGRPCKAVVVPVSSKCMSSETDCGLGNGDDSGIRVRLINGISKNNDIGYAVTEHDDAAYTNLGYDGVPAYKFVNVTYEYFQPNALVESNIGRMNCRIIALPKTPLGSSLGDQWPFDDTLRKRFFVMRRIQGISDDVTEYHVETTTGWAVPNVLAWVAKDAYIVDGDLISMHALPPRGSFSQSGLKDNPIMPDDTIYINSPVIEMNRTRRVVGAEIESEPQMRDAQTQWGTQEMGGDELASFPIELAFLNGSDTIRCYNTAISFSYQRGKRINPGYFQNYSRFLGENCYIGPEAKIFFNNAHFSGLVAGDGGSADFLALEFAKPSDDRLNGICNIPDADWRHLPQRRGSSDDAITNIPILTIFGGGGFLRGFLAEDPDSAVSYPTQNAFNAIDEDGFYNYFIFDEGLDADFRKFVIQIPDTFVNWKNLGANNFRFRFKVYAKNHQEDGKLIPDDYDDFFIDNIFVTKDSAVIREQLKLDPDVANTKSDAEFVSVSLEWPYTMVPASQASEIPIKFKIANNSNKVLPSLTVKVKIFREGDFNKITKKAYPDKLAVYCRTVDYPNIIAGQEIEANMPIWDARGVHKYKTDENGDPLPDPMNNKYIIVGTLIQEQPDLVPNNDTTYFDVELRLGNVFAYDPIGDMICSNGVPGIPYDTISFPMSDVDQEFGVNDAGRGLCLAGHSYESGNGHPPLNTETRVGDGILVNPRAGKFATKFKTIAVDSIHGFQAYFTTLNSTPNEIEFDILKGGANLPSDESMMPAGKPFIATRMLDALTGEFVLDEYATYILDEPIELAPGTYWISLLQKETDGLNLGATSARSGLKVSNFYQDPITGVWAASGSSLYMDKTLRKRNGLAYVNRSIFAYVNANNSDAWNQFTPTANLVGYPHTNHQGKSLKDESKVYLNGSWLPLLRPYFGDRTFGSLIGTKDEYYYDDCGTYPVELVAFNGRVRKGGIELAWETASEENNHGFELQRACDDLNQKWAPVAFISGNGTTVIRSYYNHFDDEVVLGETYQYRLNQIDSDGTVSCDYSNTITVKYEDKGVLNLSQNSPNPFSGNTSIAYQLPFDSDVKLEVIDIYGNVVKVIFEAHKAAGNYSAIWYGENELGNRVANGNYLYRLTANDEVKIGKMSFIR